MTYHPLRDTSIFAPESRAHKPSGRASLDFGSNEIRPSLQRAQQSVKIEYALFHLAPLLPCGFVSGAHGHLIRVGVVPERLLSVLIPEISDRNPHEDFE